ncbi:UbiD family decarboxylase [Rathayibacter sp. VKM Ac-2835]|uniref:UbiD family decarboxylase n=1 Tax=Rathayibacter sp. VKM Ac-2835 TaxID=2739043 RepID=UPI0015673952|nr:UbiD family decarboxylase [Rathayibacter sp. VKM Ac-2835]NRG42014.1 UbiD family decarboxylase [Rathayibacter sp. VKM Ac-2835]
MGEQSLRAYVDALPADELVVIDRAVDARFELASVLALLDRGPAVRLSAVTGSAHPVVGNVLSSRSRLARAVGCDVDQLLDTLTAAVADRQPVLLVDDAPVQEVRLPASAVWDEVVAPTWFEKDSGGYVTAGMIVAFDPVTGHRNASYARIKPLGETTGFVGIAPNHHLTAMSRSAAAAGGLPVAVVLGAHPAIQMAACCYLALGDDELEHAAHLLGEPVRVARATTSDVLVPADAEIVVEGLLHADRPVHEGLVNEYHGMYEDYGDGVTLEVTAVTRRSAPEVQVILPGLSSEHSYIAALPIAAGIKHALRNVGCDIVDVAVTHSGGGRVDVVVSIANGRPGAAKRVMFGAFAAVSMVKQVTVVDADVNAWDQEHVHWARTSRLRWDRDLVLVDGVATDRNVPMQIGGTVTKVGMDATRKEGDRAIGADLAVPPPAILRSVRDALVADGLGGALRPAIVVHGSLTEGEGAR